MSPADFLYALGGALEAVALDLAEVDEAIARFLLETYRSDFQHCHNRLSVQIIALRSLAARARRASEQLDSGQGDPDHAQRQ